MQEQLQMMLPPSGEKIGRWVFPSAYGGAVDSAAPPQIHELLGKLRREVGAVAAKKQAGGPMFPVRGAKELNQKLADALNSLNMVAAVVAQEVNLLPTDEIPQNTNAKGTAPVFRTLAHVKATVRLIAPDTSFIDFVGSGHGGDVDDKSGGKASTYAWKDAILKGLSIPHEDMVDTDDDSSTGEGKSSEGRGEGVTVAEKVRKYQGKSKKDADSGSKGETQGAQSEAQPMVHGSNEPEVESVGEGLAATLAAIKGANSEQDLEPIREAIKSGAAKLHGAQKLTATKAWVARKEEIKNKKAGN